MFREWAEREEALAAASKAASKAQAAESAAP
jgi:hypothetical protein